MKKYALKIAYPILMVFWFIFKPRTYGVRCILLSEDNEVLLIKNTYRKFGWDFPGGGIKRGESPVRAVVREVFEEVGMTISEPELLGEFTNEIEYKKDKVVCFLAKVKTKEFTIDPVEIEDVRWFNLNNLPNDICPLVDSTLELWKR
jgi:mutator protein MutT